VVLVMTHNLRVDTEILSGLCRSGIAYIGLLGPRHRAQRIREELEQRGLAAGRLHGPTGLDIGAEGPEAIALAIVAEIHAVLQGRAGGSLRDRTESIHERAA
jgi:xanthine dehydrogenase accessory factor